MVDDTFNYHDICNLDTPKRERAKKHIGDIYLNAARCGSCHDYIISKNIHDFRTCSCGNVSVDGGSHYVRRSFKTINFIDDVIYFNDVKVD